MDFSVIFRNLPDAVCVVDTLGNIIQSSDLFQETFVNSGLSINFVNDVLHQQHRSEYDIALEKVKSDFRLGTKRCVSLGLLKTLTISQKFQQFPVYQLVDWSVSSLDNDTFILSGRCSSKSDDLQKFGSITSACVKDASDTSSACNLPNSSSHHPYDDMVLELIDFFQHAPIALHWLSGTGVILWANDTELKSLGFTAEEYIGQSITKFLMPGEEEHLQEVFGNLMAGRTIHDAPFRFRAKNGDVKYLIVDSNVNFNEDGSFRHTRCFIRNDTDRRLKEEILLASNRIMKKEAEAKSAFIRHVFHEMRTPLHVLATFLHSYNPSPEDFQEMRHHTDSALAMVDDLTFATTFEAGEISKVTPLPVHIPSLLQQVIQAVNTVEQRGGHAVEIRLHTIGMTAEDENRLADPSLSRVIYSLLSNAVRYSPAAGHYVDLIMTYTAESVTEGYSDGPVGSKRSRDDGSTASSAQCSGSFTFQFKNSTVIPMDPTTVRKYFSVYYHFDLVATEESSAPALTPSPIPDQADLDSLTSIVDDVEDRLSSNQSIPSSCTASSREAVSGGGGKSSGGGGGFRDLKSVKGLGLGLYTAFNMVKLMGGHLECSAASPNEACFWFTVSLLPCLTALPVREIPTDVTALLGEPVDSIDDAVPVSNTCEMAKLMRVLIVDDSSMCQKLIVKSLKGLEFLTEVASNGWEACEKLQQTPCRFDAVLMDLRMPVMDGLEATRYCREVLKLCNLPIIAITAEIGAAIKEEAIKSGASHFLSKPAKAQEIISILRSLDINA